MPHNVLVNNKQLNQVDHIVACTADKCIAQGSSSNNLCHLPGNLSKLHKMTDTVCAEVAIDRKADTVLRVVDCQSHQFKEVPRSSLLGGATQKGRVNV